MCNADVRSVAKSSNVFLYQIADKLGISEPTMTRKMRYELADYEKERIFETIRIIVAERENSLKGADN